MSEANRRKKLHILLCSHNGGKYIYAQLKSFCDQKRQIDSVHIYDFGSKDNTRDEILRAIETLTAGTGPIFHLNYIAHAPGVTQSFFLALRDLVGKLNTCDLVFISDQDDVWMDIKTEVMVDVFEKSEKKGVPTLVHHDVLVVDECLNQIADSYYNKRQLALLLNNPSPLNKHFGLVIGHTMLLDYEAVKIIASLEYDERILMYDWYWGCIISEVGDIKFVNQKLSKYRQHDNNILGARSGSGTNSAGFIDFVKYTRAVANQLVLCCHTISRLSSKKINKRHTSFREYVFLVKNIRSIKILALRALVDLQTLLIMRRRKRRDIR